MSIKDITVVITSLKSENKIRKCLNSIDKECNVINVENSNNLEHKKNIEKEFNNVKCILAGENLGYGRANNIGLKEVKTKYALILNPDTELFPKTLEKFMEVAKQRPDFAIIGPNIFEDKKNYTYEEKYPFGEPIGLDIKVVKTVKGFAMFLNLPEFKEVGFLMKIFLFILKKLIYVRDCLKKIKKFIGVQIYQFIMKEDSLMTAQSMKKWSFQEIGIGCGQPFIIIKNTKVFLFLS